VRRSGAEQYRPCVCANARDRFDHNDNRYWYQHYRNHVFRHAAREHGPLSIGRFAKLFVLSAVNAHHAWVSVYSTELSDEPQRLIDYADYQSGLFVNICHRNAIKHGNGCHRRRLPIAH
jgi:hypothetical protein